MTEPATSKSNGRGVAKKPRRQFEIPPVVSLDELRGVHPDALRDIYGVGEPADPALLAAAGGRARIALLSLESGRGTFLLTRPLVRFASRYSLLKEKVFESGTSGANQLLGRKVMRFHCEGGPSVIDGDPTLLLRYDGFGNPWPVSAIVDELRIVGDARAMAQEEGARVVGIGPVTFGPERRVLFWWGLEV